MSLSSWRLCQDRIEKGTSQIYYAVDTMSVERLWSGLYVCATYLDNESPSSTRGIALDGELLFVGLIFYSKRPQDKATP